HRRARAHRGLLRRDRPLTAGVVLVLDGGAWARGHDRLAGGQRTDAACAAGTTSVVRLGCHSGVVCQARVRRPPGRPVATRRCGDVGTTACPETEPAGSARPRVERTSTGSATGPAVAGLPASA